MDAVSVFEDFFEEKMRDELTELAQNKYPDESRSVGLDWKELSRFNAEVADALLEKPDRFLEFAEDAVQHLNIDTGGDEKFKPHVRFYNLPPTSSVLVKNVGASNLGKLFQVEGVVQWVTELKPLMQVAQWYCSSCEDVNIKTVSDKSFLRKPWCPKCGREMRLREESSDFINFQRAQMQESVERLKGSAPAARLELWMEDDITNFVMPGEKIRATGILRLRPLKHGRGKSSIYEKFLDVVHIKKIEQEFESLVVTPEEKKEVEALARDPLIYEKIVKSIAPSIHGFNELKQAIALQLFSGTPNKVQADGEKIRSDMHLLLIGDPGCLIGDERVVLGNGTLAKIQDLGEGHLQEINQPLLIGQGYKRATAKRFHVYENQPILELLTESGKCIKGTFNHPLLVVDGMRRQWKRLDEIKPGERVAVVPWIPCTKTALVKTGWKKVLHKFGPRSKAKLPGTLDAGLAGFLGYVLGDGWVRRTCVAMDVNTEEQDLIPLLVSMIQRKFNVVPRVRVRKKPNRKPITIIECNSVDVAANLSFLKEKRVPELVMQSGNKPVAKFLSWLFEADGCVFSKGRGKRAIQLKSSEPELLRDVQILLLRFRVHSRLNERNLTIRRAQSIRCFAKSIGFRSKKKKTKLKKLVNDCKALHHERGRELSERVVSIKPAGFADVFDVEVPAAKRFIANGIVSHNTGKSSILEYVGNLAPKSVNVSGGAASGVGLTASAEKDSLGEGWILKAGAMVLANGGIAIIDEFDKMSQEDRGAIHQAMEQQKISIAKAGIVTEFRSETAVLAAANPKMGRFDPNRLPAEQFNISPALLSRFDLIFTVRDVLDETTDRNLASHVLAGHKYASLKQQPPKESPLQPAIKMDLLRKYIAYARKTCFPVLTDEAINKIRDYYVTLRKTGKEQNTFPITARQIEGIIRLSEASAKMRLSERVTAQDADRAIALEEYVLELVFLDKETGLFDSDIINIGKPKSQVDQIRHLMDIVHLLEEEHDLVEIDEIKRKAADYGIDESKVEHYLQGLLKEGELYKPKHGFVKSARKK